MTESINKSEFINKLGEKIDFLTDSEVDDAVRELLAMMQYTLARDGRVEVRGFGSFCLNHRKPRVARNPKTGEKVQVGVTAIPHFRPGKALKEAVNETYGE